MVRASEKSVIRGVCIIIAHRCDQIEDFGIERSRIPPFGSSYQNNKQLVSF